MSDVRDGGETSNSSAETKEEKNKLSFQTEPNKRSTDHANRDKGSGWQRRVAGASFTDQRNVGDVAKPTP